MKNKKGFEFSFGWLFAIVVGAVIIFLAIYASTSLIRQNRNIQDTFAGKELGVILSPVETSLESGKTTIISFPVETRVFNECRTNGNFGSQGISVASKSGIGKEWQVPGEISRFYNKYIFSSSTIEGKGATVLVKPLIFPFEVADLIFMWSNTDEFCFVDAPGEIEDELTGLNIKNINFTTNLGDCKKLSKKVCFSTKSGCEVQVDLISQSVKKNKQTLYFANDKENAFLYGAIFADNGIYECQVKRLMKRTAELALLYRAKSESLSSNGCSSNLEGDLSTYANQTLKLNNTNQLREIELSSDELGRRNDALSCKLF